MKRNNTTTIGDPILRDDWVKYEPFIYPQGRKKKLTKPDTVLDSPFIDVLFKRCSHKNLTFCEIRRVSEVLFYCMRIHEITNDLTGTITSKRICPSAGARHPIDIFVSLPEKLNERELFYYNPIDHSLNELMLDKKNVATFLEDINSTLFLNDAYLFWFSMQVEKTGSKYLNPESLYWRDAGCLLYAIQLISTYIGLSSCPIGTLASKSFHNLFFSDKIQSGGGILIGNQSII